MSFKSMVRADAQPGGALFPTDSDGNPDEFHEYIWLYPKGQREKKERIHAYVFRDSLPGTNENDGDGRITDRPSGQSTRDSVWIEVPSTYNLQDYQGRGEADILFFDNQEWKVDRRMGDHDGLTGYLLIHRHHHRINNLGRSG